MFKKSNNKNAIKRNINKLNASLKLIHKCANLITTIKSISNTKFEQPRVNNKYIDKAFALLQTKEAIYLYHHTTFCCDLHNTIDMNYLMDDSFYLLSSHIEIVNTIGHEWVKQFYRRSKHVNKQLIYMKSHHYKYTCYTYHENGKPVNNKTLAKSARPKHHWVEYYSGAYTSFAVPTKDNVISLINTIKSTASYSFITYRDIQALKINLKAQTEVYKMYLDNFKKHEISLSFLTKSKKDLLNDKRRLYTLDTTNPF